ncbi:MAG: two-component sensor histidine kinase [Methylococcaceae bacterium]|nr:two-component sensor histidine kinase [Methylococcaceae bacterium]
MKPTYARPLQHRALAFLVLLLLALATLGGMIWRNLHHFNTVLSHVNYSHSVQNVSVELQQALIEYLIEAVPVAYPEELTKTIAALNKTITEMDALIADDGLLSADTRASMETVRQLLSEAHNLDKIAKNTRLIGALKTMSVALDDEVIARDHLLEKISHDTETELYMASFTLVVILIVAVLFLLRRLLHPLNDLKQLLQRLTEESYIPFATDHLDPLILPVFNSYNEMVKHLAELEEANRSHARSLQKEVRIATQALLEQQYSLARAERLAAIGEVAAELAHEIRNPLAGIQMAFNNFRREIDDPQQVERMELISSELKRLATLLNDMLDHSRHSPESVTQFDVVVLIRDLVALTRYQIAEAIHLSIDAPAHLIVNLPEGGLRQALLNLLLNAADAMESGPGNICVQTFKDELGIHIKVLDNGSGFSKEMLDNGIRPFRTSRSRGTGLGLAMVLRFVKDIGGAIKLTNQSSGGACVSILLPVACITGELI